SRGGLLLAYVRSEPADQTKAPPGWVRSVGFSIVKGISPGVEFGTVLQRNPEVRRAACLETFEAFAGDTHNGEGNAVDEESRAEHVRIPREAASPVVVADHGDGRVVLLVLFRESASLRKLDAQAGEECAADHVAFSFLRLSSVADCDLVDGEGDIGDYVCEAGVLVMQGLIDRIRKRLSRIDCASPVRCMRRMQVNQAGWIADRQRAQKDSIHNAEDCGISADAECERKNCRDRESRTVEKRANAIAQVAQDAIEPLNAAAQIEALLRSPHTAEFNMGPAKSFFGAETFRAKFIRFELEVSA